MTAQEYTNIQRMIDISLQRAAGYVVDPNGHLDDGDLSTTSDLELLERDMRDETDGKVCDLQHSINMLENSIES